MDDVEFDPETGELLGGGTIETMAKDAPAGAGTLEGDSGQLSLDFGGTRPTSSTLRLTGPKGGIPLAGEFKKGDEVSFVVTGRVVEVRAKDKLDDGLVVSTDRIHIAQIEDWRLP